MATLVDPVMARWAPDTRHYVTGDGRHFAVHVAAEMSGILADLINESLVVNGSPTLQTGVHTHVIEPTTIIECNPEGIATTLTPVFTAPPGTNHEDALAQAGLA